MALCLIFFNIFFSGLRHNRTKSITSRTGLRLINNKTAQKKLPLVAHFFLNPDFGTHMCPLIFLQHTTFTSNQLRIYKFKRSFLIFYKKFMHRIFKQPLLTWIPLLLFLKFSARLLVMPHKYNEIRSRIILIPIIHQSDNGVLLEYSQHEACLAFSKICSMLKRIFRFSREYLWSFRLLRA